MLGKGVGSESSFSPLSAAFATGLVAEAGTGANGSTKSSAGFEESALESRMIFLSAWIVTGLLGAAFATSFTGAAGRAFSTATLGCDEAFSAAAFDGNDCGDFELPLFTPNGSSVLGGAGFVGAAVLAGGGGSADDCFGAAFGGSANGSESDGAAGFWAGGAGALSAGFVGGPNMSSAGFDFGVAGAGSFCGFGAGAGVVGAVFAGGPKRSSGGVVEGVVFLGTVGAGCVGGGVGAGFDGGPNRSSGDSDFGAG